MKKFLAAGAALVGFGLSSQVLAVDGTITFKGEISSKTCTIDSSSLNQTVQLVPVSLSSLAPGQNAGFKPFSISFSGCTQDAKIKANFEISPNVDLSSGTLKNELSGANASNVSVQLFNRKQQPIDLATGTNNLEATSGDSVLGFYAAYLAPVGEDVKPGQVSTKVTYTMSYE